MFKPRHYPGLGPVPPGESRPGGVMQIDHELTDTHVRRFGPPRMDKDILALAHAEYAKQGYFQPARRVQQRGGFSVLEVIALLADRVERLEAEEVS